MRLLSLPFIHLYTFFAHSCDTWTPSLHAPPLPHPQWGFYRSRSIWLSTFPWVPAEQPCTPPNPCYSPSSCRSRPVVQINASLHFEPSKINIFHRDCKRSGRDATCLAAFLCFSPVFLAPHYQTSTVGKSSPSPLPQLQSLPHGLCIHSVSKPGLLLKWVLSARSHLEPHLMISRCPFNALIPGGREGISCHGEDGSEQW